MNVFDLAAICLLAAGVFAGIRSGAMPQLGGLFGAILGGAVALLLAPVLRDQLETLEGPARALVILGGLVLCVAVGEVLGSALGNGVSSSLGNGILGTLDRVGGGLVGIAQAVLVIWLVGGLMAIGPFPTLAAQAQRSTAVRITAAALPPVSEIATDVGRLIDASGLPQVFIGLEPFPAPPVATPDEARAREIAGPAIASTAEIRSEACRFELTGTGFVVRQGYVVTNAHVVAGASLTEVTVSDRRIEAHVVLFDPALDVALLHVPGLRAPALRFATSTPARGTEAAALGHAGGGPLLIIPAAVSDSYRAEGRDLYGEAPVTRDIIELRAAIERGDSGGPLVLADGTVGGLVFAEARSDPTVGYALTPTDVATRIAPALGRTSPVATGPCVR